MLAHQKRQTLIGERINNNSLSAKDIQSQQKAEEQN